MLICSGDRDTFQLVSDQVTVLYPVKGVSELARMTPAAVTTKYGVPGLKYAMDLNGYYGGIPRLPLTPIGPEASA